MTTDSALSYHPTESLILPTKRRFFPFKIPNFHHQLHHYISTVDPDRIYVVADRVVYSIHVSSQKRETLAVIPFTPRCLAAGYGWIGIGGEVTGDCAFVKISDRTSDSSADPEASAGGSAGEESTNSTRVHKLGREIVNSVTIHRLPGDGGNIANEDIMVLSNNDKTVIIYSLTRSKVLKVLHHPFAMNYAIMSPDSTILAAVGDESRAYFYQVNRDRDALVSTESGEKVYGWTWDLLRCIELDLGDTCLEDKGCFTVAFSQFSRLCAIGSQSGRITVLDTTKIRQGGDPVCHFNSSRPCRSGGAVRCMAFAPEPWDLLVWLEDMGRAGVADVRQAFVRRQILPLDLNEPGLEQVPIEPFIDDTMGLGFDFDSQISPESRQDVQGLGSNDHLPERESVLDLPERERLIVEFLNTARWTSRLETDRRARANPTTSHPGPRPRIQDSPDGPRRASRTRPQGSDTPPQPSITLSWTASPAELQAATVDYPAESSSSDPSSSGIESSSQDANFHHSNTPPSQSDVVPSHSELRTNVAAERQRRQRQIINDAHNQREQRSRQQSLGFEPTRSPRWIRSVLNERPDRRAGRETDPSTAAGLGWGTDGRSLYVATVCGIFEFQLNIRDRKMFPVTTCR